MPFFCLTITIKQLNHYNKLMHIAEIPYIKDSSFYYEKIRHLKWPVFLDSSYQKDMAQSEIARYDIIAADPFIRVTTDKSGTFVEDEAGRKLQDNIPLKIEPY